MRKNLSLSHTHTHTHSVHTTRSQNRPQTQGLATCSATDNDLTLNIGSHISDITDYIQIIFKIRYVSKHNSGCLLKNKLLQKEEIKIMSWSFVSCS
jgi:hypothetical protein